MRTLCLILAVLITFSLVQAQDDKPGDAPKALIGKPAPDFTLDLLAGGKATLSAHKGKVVILDLWATWCAPCVAQMPMIGEVAQSYADKGVVLWAINEEEEPADITPFLKERKLDHLAIPLDKDAKVSTAYLAEGFPLTVIVGKNGNVKFVHAGISDKAELIKELDAALKE